MACLLLLGAPPARASGPVHLVILWFEGMTIEQWLDPRYPHLNAFVRDGSVGLVSTRTAEREPDPALASAAAAATIGRGEPSSGTLGPDAIARALSGGVLERSLTARAITVVDEPSEIAGAEPGLIVFAPHEPGVSMPAAEANRLLGDARVLAGATILLSPRPPEERMRAGVRLAPIAFAGVGFPEPLVTSPTTHRGGLVALADLTPTIVRTLGMSQLGPTEGRPITDVAHPDAPGAVAALDREATEAARARRPLTRSWLIAGGVLTFAALALVLGGRGVAGRGRLAPRGARDVLHALLVAVAAVPAASYAAGVLPLRSTVATVGVAWAMALGVALGARAGLGRERGLAAVLVGSAAVLAIDGAFGGVVGHRSGLTFLVALGSRFYGVGDEVLGVVTGAALLGFALLLDRAERRRRALLAAAAGLGAIVVLLGAPALGSKFGAAPTAIPAFGILAARAGGRRLDARAMAGIALATVAVTVLFVLGDALRDTGAQSHVGRAVGGETDLGDLVRRKVTQQWNTFISVTWLPASLAFGAALFAFRFGARLAFDRGMWGRPHVRAALVGAIVGVVCALAFNDGGILIAAPILLYAATTTSALLLAPE